MFKLTASGVTEARLRELALALLRIAIGWHFFYEGCSKLLHSGWTASGYLKSSAGVLAGFFQWLAADATRALWIDRLNIWGLILIGAGLMLGALIRPAALAGIALLGLYYAAHPPLFGVGQGVTEGSYLIVNKNLVELFALALVAIAPAAGFGLDGLLCRRFRVTPPDAQAPGQEQERSLPARCPPVARRQVLAAMAGMPFLGAMVLAILKKHGWRSFEETQLLARSNPRDVFVASATAKPFQFATVGELKGRLPQARIGNVSLSRMILGGNLIIGSAHARDLIYVSKLIRAYHNRDKVFETLALAERCGINTLLTNPAVCEAIKDYWRNGGRIQFISDCGSANVLEAIQKSIDAGASACYIQGEAADRMVERGQFDQMAKCLDLIRKNGLPAGIGAHELRTIQGAVAQGLRPDFWVKTLHQTNYWSASHKPKHDNIWCDNPEETVAFMKELKEPWIAFKVLAAGAIEPRTGFRYAFESGADFICVGMYDFQIVEDVNLALAVLNGKLARERQWRA